VTSRETKYNTYTVVEFAAQGCAWTWRSVGNVELRRARVDLDAA